ncbi:MAG TPA: hypothetical protein VFF69_06130 [Phycisphaerales bacterium]|nr:hypothetical protein [Phycisphaerales bacterium]
MPRLIALLLVLAVAAPAHAQSTAFTYQGRLNDGGNPAGGRHDLRFTLFNAPTGGAQIGTPQCVDNAMVVDGYFTASIDFGQSFATTADRYLEVEVRKDTGLSCGNVTGFSRIISRQAITATPRASHAESAFALAAADGFPMGAVNVDADGDVGIGTSAPATRLDVRGGSISVVNTGDQADLLWLNSERPWVFRQEGTGPTTALKLESVGGGGNKHFIFDTTGAVGIGTTLPQATLDVRGDMRLGPSGSLFAAAGGERLRVIRGTVDPLANDGQGAILVGEGFSIDVDVDRRETYIIFDTSFSDIPAVVGSSHWDDFWGGKFVTVDQFRRDRVRIMLSMNDGDFLPHRFSFIAIGPR